MKPTGIFGACEVAMVRAELMAAGTRWHQGCWPAMGTGRVVCHRACVAHHRDKVAHHKDRVVRRHMPVA